MSERNAPSRAFTIGGGIAAIAGLAAALTLNARSFTQTDWIVALCGAAAFCFIALNGLPVRGLRLRRTGLAAEALFLDLPVAVTIFTLGGAVGPSALALAYALGFGAASLVRAGERVADLPRHGVLRMLVALLWLPFMGSLATLNALPDAQQVPLAACATFCFYVVFIFGASVPISSYTFHISIARLWERVARDERTWGLIIGGSVWATLEGYEVVHGHPYAAMVMWLPVCSTAVLLRTIERQHAEVVRLRLVRDAVQAMLGDRDPLPQINAILATLRVPSFQETVSVLAATGTRTENWRTVTTIGPMLSSAGDELGRRILVRLKRQREDPEGARDEPAIERDEYYSAYAFAASQADGELHGALTVHRRNDRPLTGEQIQQFTNAARELAPLLRDMRSIAARQSAATIDGLTGLCNRTMTMERLQTMLKQISITEDGAVLLLDIDHFKTINDELGHATGDNCLRRVGEIIRATVRGGDTAGRIGGEEFLVVMPGASRDVALSVGERLRLAVSLSGMRYASGEPITTSIGAAAARVGDTVETLLARADRGLYEAKRQGRNRLVEDRETA
ncbi:MAG TPA: GGDEF domain-containing protein [Candidatus Acidoferrales bacterium]|nr:GGDEF domain-containing protein [Candidatus Acidoferrales bacterium]